VEVVYNTSTAHEDPARLGTLRPDSKPQNIPREIDRERKAGGVRTQRLTRERGMQMDPPHSEKPGSPLTLNPCLIGDGLRCERTPAQKI
jgi:hypothetical protein